MNPPGRTRHYVVPSPNMHVSENSIPPHGGKIGTKSPNGRLTVGKIWKNWKKIGVSQKPMQVGTLETLSLNLPAFDLEPVQ